MDEGNLALILRQCLGGGNSAQWEAFFALAQPMVASAIIRTLARGSAMNRDLADDLIQNTFVKICDDNFRVLRNFRSDDPTALRAYLKTVPIRKV